MERLAELRDQILRIAPDPSLRTGFAGMSVMVTGQPTAMRHGTAEPTLAIVAQGTKRALLGDRVFDYGPGQFLVSMVDVPLSAGVTEAHPDAPFVGFSLALRPTIVAELLIESGLRTDRTEDRLAVMTSDADDLLLDALIRLLRLVGVPDDLRMLGPGAEREVHWRLMTGPQGATIRQIGVADSRLAIVRRAIAWIQAHFDEVIRIDDLADAVGVSVSSLNRHFRAATTMSPLQYQKQIRLHQARIQLLATPGDVAGVGYAVGYGSPSQFSREYHRMFGVPPSRDALHLHDHVPD